MAGFYDIVNTTRQDMYLNDNQLVPGQTKTYWLSTVEYNLYTRGDYLNILNVRESSATVGMDLDGNERTSGNSEITNFVNIPEETTEYTLTAEDNGKILFFSDIATLYVPNPEFVTGFDQGWYVTLITRTSELNILPAPDEENDTARIYQASDPNDTGSAEWTMPACSLATLTFIYSDSWYLSGPGIVEYQGG